MNPKISNISEDGDVYKFTLYGLNVSLANAIRRIILSEIPTVVIHTENYEENQCNILVNTSRLHNEIIKQRLSCIPIHKKELDVLPGNYVLEVDVTNDTENIMYVTTEHFKIRNKTTGKYATEEETRSIFPVCNLTQSYIDFVRLRPKISDTIPGEQLKLVAEFSIHSAKKNSMYNVVSKCAYSNTIDTAKVSEVWNELELKHRAQGLNKEEIEFQKRNYYLLDAQRQFVPDSFDFVVQTVGVFENREIVRSACHILQKKFGKMIEEIDSDSVEILRSENTIDNCYDIILENEDYTMGKVIEYILYEKYWNQEPKVLSFCGFKKMHPHNTESIVRIAFMNAATKEDVRSHLRYACSEAQELYKKITTMF